MRDRIEKILQDKEMTQAEFADLIGVNRSSITHLMTGRNKSSDTVAARTLLAFPDINPNWLSYGDGDMYLDYVYTPTPKLLFKEDERSDDEKPLADLGKFNSENQEQTTNSINKNTTIESNIQPASLEDNKILKSQEVLPHIVEKKFPAVSDIKQIKKIVFFYTDKTFEEYYPENEN